MPREIAVAAMTVGWRVDPREQTVGGARRLGVGVSRGVRAEASRGGFD